MKAPVLTEIPFSKQMNRINFHGMIYYKLEWPPILEAEIIIRAHELNLCDFFVYK